MIVEVHCNFLERFVGSKSNLAVSVVPLLTAVALDPELAIHLSVLRGIVIDLEAVVALHVPVEHKVATLAKHDSLSSLELDRLEDCGQDLLLQFTHAFDVAASSILKGLGLQQTQWAELVEALLDDLGDFADRRLLADGGVCRINEN